MTAALGSPTRLVAAAGRSWPTGVIAAVLVLDGVVTLLLEALFLPIYLGRADVPESPALLAQAQPLAATLTAGAVPFPITVLIAAVVNVLLVKGMSTVTDRIGMMALPLTAWTVTYMLCTLGGPGGDVLFMNDWPTLALLVGGLLPAGLYLYYLANLSPAGSVGARYGA
ncbi:hypothetical protein HLB23_08190 [Nocardia uniformis]|uniref:Uncharacterized protein n=1 Tax=Nocardia uniformis TaxID=53432 RepID=A0A849BUI8_9NOCA|nr:hypothetical protein [Nocardia uniformis]NNH69844.1 hypothetical protein [Nocardia uniformis]